MVVNARTFLFRIQGDVHGSQWVSAQIVQIQSFRKLVFLDSALCNPV